MYALVLMLQRMREPQSFSDTFENQEGPSRVKLLSHL